MNFKPLSPRTIAARERILLRLSEGPALTGELAALCAESRKFVANHLRTLAQRGLVVKQPAALKPDARWALARTPTP